MNAGGGVDGSGSVTIALGSRLASDPKLVVRGKREENGGGRDERPCDDEERSSSVHRGSGALSNSGEPAKGKRSLASFPGSDPSLESRVADNLETGGGIGDIELGFEMAQTTR